MRNFFIKIIPLIKNYKKIVWSTIILFGIVCYFIFGYPSSKSEITYVLDVAKKGTIISSVTGSGQIESSNQIDLKAQSTGDITYVAVKPGQQVQKGQTLFALDARNAQKMVRDAQTALETAQLDLEKFKKGPKSIDVELLEADITRAEKSKVDADKVIATAYRNLLNTSVAAVSTVSYDTRTPPTITGTYTGDHEAIIKIHVYGTQGGQQYFNIESSPADVVNITGTGLVSANVLQPLGDSGLYIKFASINDIAPSEWIITLPNKTASNYESNLKIYNDATENKKEIVIDANLNIDQDKQKILDLYTPDALDLRSKELTIKQREDALMDAKVNLSDYYIKAPFDGIIASVVAKVGETVSGTLATIVTAEKIATIQLNEVDISKIKLGQKVTLTFDAIEDLALTGEIAEIDTIGTVSQGVVNYKVKITFDTNSEKIKPGMSVSVSIIVDIKQDVLVVPSSAVKTSASGSYVQQFINPPTMIPNANGGVVSDTLPIQKSVEIGLSNDVSIEIVSGISEGEQIIMRTITVPTVGTTAQAPSLFSGGTSGVRASTRGASVGGSNFTPR